MKRLRSRKTLVILAAALLVVGGGGVAIAASSESSPGRLFLDSVAKHLGVSSDELDDAIKAAAIERVDAALDEGRITQEQADELKERIESGEFPPFGPSFGPMGGPFEHGVVPFPLFGERLDAAADYLDLTEAELREKLNDGQTLAEIAQAEDKSVDGLKHALVDAAKVKLDQLVDDGDLTQAQADAMLERLREHVDELVENGRFRFHFRDHGPGFGLGPFS
jgi:hypothetical protein